MERWANKVAVVTGAASGIGAQFCRDLYSHQVTVIGLDINQDLLDQLATEINSKGRFIPQLCDLTKEDEIQATFEQIISEHGGVDILVNCAGIFPKYAVLHEDSYENVLKTLQTNLLAVISCTKKAFKSMSDRDVEGHIVTMGSIAGHITSSFPGVDSSAMYYTTKAAVKTLNQMLAKELVYYKKPKIRLSNISPSLVGGTNLGKRETATTVDLKIRDFAFKLSPKDISDTLIYILSTPAHVQVRDIILESAGSGFY